jgi:hypothetical protein
MKEFFENRQQYPLIKFIGKYPGGRPMVSELVPKNFEGGLLHKMLFELQKDTEMFIPIPSSYMNLDGMRFELVYPSRRAILVYDSSFLAGYGGSSFYEETLSVWGQIILDINFFKERFKEFKEKYSEEVASEQEIFDIKQAIEIYHSHDDARMKC